MQLLLLATCCGVTTPSAQASVSSDRSELKKKHAQFLALKKKYDAEARASQVATELLLEIGELRVPTGTSFIISELKGCDPRKDVFFAERCVHALTKDPSLESVQAILSTGFDKLSDARFNVINLWLTEFSPEAVEWLMEKGWKGIASADEKAQQVWMKVLEATGDTRRVHAARGIVSGRRATSEVMIKAIKWVVDNPIEGDSKKIGKLLRHRDAEVQVTALFALQSLQATDQSKAFFDGLESRHWQVRVAAVDILGETRQRTVIEHLLPLLEDRDSSVQIAVVQALRKMGGDEVIDPLINLLEKSANGRVRDDVAETLVFLTGKDFDTVPDNWRSWWNSNRGSVEIVSISRDEYDRIKEEAAESKTGVGEYFGLRVVSSKMTFVIDTSQSMSESYGAEMTQGGGSGKGRKGQGRTGTPDPEPGKGAAGEKRVEQLQKITVAQDELKKVINSLKEGTAFNIFSFSGSYIQWKRTLVSLDKAIRKEALEFVDSLSPSGQTNVYDTLLEALGDPEVNTIYFLSDGAPTTGTVTDPEKILEAVREVNKIRKIKIYTIGFNLDDKATELMKRLAEENFGRFIAR